MKRILLFIFLCVVSGNELQFNKLEITILPQDSEILKIPALDLKLGNSGIITREIENNLYIIGTASISDINNGVASLSVLEFSALDEEYLPKPLGSPKVGDKIIFRALYNRALILAPNQNSYQNIQGFALNSNPKLDIIHPDIFISFLAKNDVDMPEERDFMGFCNQFNIGLVFIANNSGFNVLDCQSLKVLGNISLKSNMQENNKLPFWNRLGDEALGEIFNTKNFLSFNYFNNLIAKNNPQTKKRTTTKRATRRTK